MPSFHVSRRGASKLDPADPLREARKDAHANEVAAALRSAAELIRSIDEELVRKTRDLRSLELELETVRQLAGMREPQVRALRRFIESAFTHQGDLVCRRARRDQVVFFLAGLLMSIPVQILIELFT